jgi:hypothetical protein
MARMNTNKCGATSLRSSTCRLFIMRPRYNAAMPTQISVAIEEADRLKYNIPHQNLWPVLEFAEIENGTMSFRFTEEDGKKVKILEATVVARTPMEVAVVQQYLADICTFVFQGSSSALPTERFLGRQITARGPIITMTAKSFLL